MDIINIKKIIKYMAIQNLNEAWNLKYTKTTVNQARI